MRRAYFPTAEPDPEPLSVGDAEWLVDVHHEESWREQTLHPLDFPDEVSERAIEEHSELSEMWEIWLVDRYESDPKNP